MNTPSFKEDHISQIPALQMLINMGYSYLSQEEALQVRGNKTANVILDDILRKQLKELSSIQLSSSKTSYFSDAKIEESLGKPWKSGLPPHLHSFSFFVCKGNTKFRFATPLQTPFT